jgi:hypothetical protein
LSRFLGAVHGVPVAKLEETLRKWPHRFNKLIVRQPAVDIPHGLQSGSIGANGRPLNAGANLIVLGQRESPVEKLYSCLRIAVIKPVVAQPPKAVAVFAARP